MINDGNAETGTVLHELPEKNEVFIKLNMKGGNRPLVTLAISIGLFFIGLEIICDLNNKRMFFVFMMVILFFGTGVTRSGVAE